MPLDTVLRPTSRAADLTAGLCVAGLLLPEAVAYAGIAHVPVQHALAAVLLGLVLYACLGGSRFAVVAPTSSTAALTAAAALGLSGHASGAATGAVAPYGTAYFALVLLAGVLLVVLGVARQGQLSAYVSRPVLRGFAFSLALTIVVRQLPQAVGLTLEEGPGDPLHVAVAIATRWPQWHGPTLAVAVAAGATLLVLRRWPRLPGTLLMMVAAIAASMAWHLADAGVAEVGTLAPPAWVLSVPHLSLAAWTQVAELSFGLVMLVFAESWGSMRSLALSGGDTVDANRELLALGICNVACGLFQGMAVGAGFSASVANASAGARSKAAGLVAWAVVVAAAWWALPWLSHMPRAVLAVSVVAALAHSLSLKPLAAVWRMGRDRWLLVGAVVAVMFLGILHGLLAAIGLSLVDALRRFSRPVVHELGRLGDSHNFVTLNGRGDALRQPGMLIVRPEEPLFFASAERVTADILATLARQPDVHTLVVSLEESADLDSTAVECLLELERLAALRGTVLLLSRVKDPVRELLARCAPQGLGDGRRLFFSVDDAVRSAPPSPASHGQT